MPDFKQTYYWLLKKLFGYSRPLPSEDDVRAELIRLLGPRNERSNEWLDNTLSAESNCCMYVFQEGGSVTAPEIKTNGKCQEWGDWWKYKQGRAGAAHFLPHACPPGSTDYQR